MILINNLPVKCIVVIALLSLLSCKDDKKTIAPDQDTVVEKIKDKNFIPYESVDTLFARFDQDSYVKGKKTLKGICLDYKIHHQEQESTMYFQYSDYSDVVFPKESIGVVFKSSYRITNAYLYNDSILVLPLIGINNLITAYLINLDSQEVVGDDIRTSFGLVWISDESMLKFITVDTPFKKDGIYKYTLSMSYLKLNRIIFKRKMVNYQNKIIKDSVDTQYKIVKKIL